MKNHNAEELKTLFPRAVEAIIEQHYVDDHVDSFDNWEEGKKIVEQES